jgi:hypothetical protein
MRSAGRAETSIRSREACRPLPAKPRKCPVGTPANRPTLLTAPSDRVGLATNSPREDNRLNEHFEGARTGAALLVSRRVSRG